MVYNNTGSNPVLTTYSASVVGSWHIKPKGTKANTELLTARKDEQTVRWRNWLDVTNRKAISNNWFT